MSFTFAFDVTGWFYSQAPQGFPLCGYDTGPDGIAWTAAMWEAHPGAVHIDQDPAASNSDSDVLDCESGAVAVGSPLIPAWAEAAQHNFTVAARPGQRRPALYCSADNVTANVNVLAAAGITGVGLWIADWNLSSAEAVAAIAASAGPYPVIGIQFTDDGDFDSDVFSTAWLEDVSGKPQPGPWTFGELTDFALTAYGPHSLAVRFSAPQAFTGTPPSPAPGIPCYQMAVSKGAVLGPDIDDYPRYLPKGANPQTWASGGLTPGTQYTAGVRAYLEGHAGPWSDATFTTPES